MPEITVTLKAGYEKINPTNEFGLKYPPLYHQQRTYDELKANDLVINTYNTGTGKTKASLLQLFDLKDENDNVLFIAPTNELIRQHAEDIRDFVEEHELNFEVAEVTGKKLREWEGVYDPGYPVRNPRKLHEIIEDPRNYFPNLTGRKKLILVTNPDIFYLCFYSLYSEMDSANLFRDFLVKFNYIVIDEFHYYNAKQLANFLMFFILSKEYGYFNAGRKICLLSATPDDELFKYLNEIDLKYKLVSPDNEPAESNEYEKIQTLSEIDLTIHSNKIETLKDNPESVLEMLNSDKEGAVISSSLRTITDINQGLKNAGLKGKIGLITGAVDSKERGEATKSYPLVLATPTVDIGYNFKKVDKLRQNIDFVCFDALYGSEFTQRIGRAGRLLGKTDTAHRSVAHAFVQGKLYAQLEAGKSYDRREFAKLVKNALGEDNRFYYYIQSYAVLEAFYPLCEHYKRTSEDRQDRVREVFETIRQVFAPASETTFDEMMKKIRWHVTYETVIKDSAKRTYNDYVSHQWERAAWSYCRHQAWLAGTLETFEKLTKEKERVVLATLLKNHRAKILEHAEQKYTPIKSLFNFRGSDVSIRCAIYDPNHFFQNTANYTEYDLFHVLLHYEFTVILTKEKYHELTGNWGNYCDFFVRVDARKESPAKIEFDYNASGINQEDFERQHCWGPTALKGLRFRNVRLEMQGILEDKYITCLLSKMENRGALNNILETKRLFAYPLHVIFHNGQKEYKLVLGAQAFLIHAELQGKWKEKTQTTT